jgi:HEAT repeat protein
MITYGRYPTLGEVTEYYRREDVLTAILRTCGTHDVVLVIPTRRHWEPDWERDRVRVSSRSQLREFLLGRIAGQLGHLAPNERPPFYPSLHQRLERRSASAVGEGSRLGTDGVLESDLPTWREAFRDLLTLIQVLQEEEIPHRLKFSGHRSLHLLVPFAGRRLHGGSFGESAAHPVGILRLPYSLNEDTGLVSMPLSSEELSAFRPWQANLHLVEMRDGWWIEPTDDDRNRVRGFLSSLPHREQVPRVVWFDPQESHDRRLASWRRVRDRSLRLAEDPSEVQGRAWRRLFQAESVTMADLRAALQHPDPEARWLTAEAYLLHGADLRPDLLPLLLSERDPYARVAALDTMLRFPDQLRAFAVSELGRDDLRLQPVVLGVLSQCDALWDDVQTELSAKPERSAVVATRLACVAGTVEGDWTRAWHIIRQAERRHPTDPRWGPRLQALKVMQDMSREWSPREIMQRAFELSALGADIFDLLLLGVGSRERRFRRAFLIALSELGDARALDVFVSSLSDRYRDMVRWATRGLLRLGPSAVPALIDAADSDDARLRRYAIRCLSHLGDQRARDTVFGALGDEDAQVRRQAILGARHFATIADLDRLRDVARRDTGREAVALLTAFGDAGGEAITSLALEDGVPAAACWLWRQGDERGRQVLLAAVGGSADKAEMAIECLGEAASDESLVDILVEYVRRTSDWYRRATAVDALVRMGHPKGLEALIGLSHSGSRPDRKQAAEALGRWDDPRAAEALVAMLGDERKVRPTVIEALIRQGERGRLALAAAEEHLSPRIRREAAAIARRFDLEAGPGTEC